MTAGAWDDNRNYDFFLSYRGALAESGVAAIFPSTVEEHGAAHAKFSAPPGARSQLDVSLVIDTTGSMTDEIDYLQAEFEALTGSIRAKFPSAAQRWSLVVYRDEGDAYVTRSFEFFDDGNLGAFRELLGEQQANGGGDFPEAPEQALEQAATLEWRSDGGVAKLLFWVADAPPHDRNAGRMVGAVRALAERGVHVYPVASSGIDEAAEFSMRSAAQLTGGRYLFLTSDSGVGGPHKEPTVPCYFVTKLDDAIVRMVSIEMTGVYAEPDPSEVLRVGGEPRDGACALGDGQQVLVF